MHKKYLVIGILATAAIVAAVTISNTFAASSDNNNGYGYGRMGMGRGAGQNYNSDAHQKMLDAINGNNYSQWKEARDQMGMGNRGMMSNINEQNFSQFSQAHRLMSEGKYDEARKIMQDLGMNCPMMGGQGQGSGGLGRGMMNNR